MSEKDVQGYGRGCFQNDTPKRKMKGLKRDPREPQPSELVSRSIFQT